MTENLHTEKMTTVYRNAG